MAAIRCQCLVSRITGNLGTDIHMSGKRVNRDLTSFACKVSGLAPFYVGVEQACEQDYKR